MLYAGGVRRVWIVVLLVACGSPPPVTPPQPAMDLGALADRIEAEPGTADAPPLLDAVPAPFRVALLGDDYERAAAIAHAAIEQRSGGNTSATTDTATLMTIFRGALAMERRAAHDDCDLACTTLLEQLYTLLDVPWMADPDGYFAQMFAVMARAATSTGADAATELLRVVPEVATRARRRHRWAAARLLRARPDGPEAAVVLRHLGWSAAADEDYPRAAALFREALGRGAEPDAAAWLDLAEACYRSLDVACGDRAARGARRASGAATQRSRLDGLRGMHAGARALAGARPPRSFEQRLARARAELDLGRSRAAEAIYADLARAHPRDARPRVGLAAVAAARNLRIRAVRAQLDRAASLEPKQRDYYELEIAAWQADFLDAIGDMAGDPDHFYQRLAAELPHLRSIVDGLARFEPGRMAPLQALLDLAGELIADGKDLPADQVVARVTHTLGVIESLRDRYPHEDDVHKAAYVLVQWSADRALARSVLGARLPRGLRHRSEVDALRDRARYRLAVTWNDPSLLPRGSKQPELDADAWALRARASGHPSDWRKAERRYRHLLRNASGEPRARLLNNLGVTLVGQGRRRAALAAWKESIDGGATTRAPDLNRAVTEGDQNALADLASWAGWAGLEWQAAMWRLATGGLSPADARAIRRHANERLARVAGGVRQTDGRAGALLDATFQVSLGYSTVEGVVTNWELPMKTWLVIPAPAPTARRAQGTRAKPRRTTRLVRSVPSNGAATPSSRR